MSYKVILQDKYDITGAVESIRLQDSLHQIAYQASIRLTAIDSLPVITPGLPIRISGEHFGKEVMAPLLNPGVVWEANSVNSGQKHLELTVFDRTIYLDKSEDEYLFPKGQTASQRLRKYAADWDMKLASVPDTATKLGKAVYRAQSLFSMMFSDLKETAKSGGELYHLRMTSAGLQLFQLGSNTEVFVLDPVSEVSQSRTLEGAVTKVKVVAANTNTVKEVPSKVLAMEEKDTKTLGTLQVILQDDKVNTAAAARKLAKSKLTGIQQTISVTAPDINTIRAGDAVMLGSLRLIVISVSRELGNPGSMSLELGTYGDVKRRFYLD